MRRADISGHGEVLPPSTSESRIRETFGRLRFRLQVGLLLAFLAPLAVLSLHFHLEFNYALKRTGRLQLTALAQSQRNTIDLFLRERVLNVFSLFQGRLSQTLPPTQADMEDYLRELRQANDAFIDFGFFDPEGLQVGYAGPFPFLQGKDYSKQEWFSTLSQQDRNYYVSDIYLGFREKLHFTIAVKQQLAGETWVMRATLDPNKFYQFLRTISEGKGINIALINEQGFYQVVDPNTAEPFSRCEFLPTSPEEISVEEVRSNGDSILVAFARSKETLWTLIVKQPFGVAYARLYQVRRIMIASTVLLVLAIGTALWLTVDRLVKRAQATAETKADLQTQLFHATKLAAVGELAAGIAHEINNPLAAISANCGVIKDMLDPQFHVDWKPEDLKEELDNIDRMVFRAREIITKLMDFSRKHPPQLVPCSVNEILDDVVSGLKAREFAVSDIEVVKNYDPAIPVIPLDPDQIRQVFLNLLNNAGDAIEGAGTITLSSRCADGYIRVAFTDTGKGIPPQELERIFLPFHTTKEVGKGTGLGLSISLNIVESMGGEIQVQSTPGFGSTFTVVLPARREKETENGDSCKRSQ